MESTASVTAYVGVGEGETDRDSSTHNSFSDAENATSVGPDGSEHKPVVGEVLDKLGVEVKWVKNAHDGEYSMVIASKHDRGIDEFYSDEERSHTGQLDHHTDSAHYNHSNSGHNSNDDEKTIVSDVSNNDEGYMHSCYSSASKATSTSRHNSSNPLMLPSPHPGRRSSNVFFGENPSSTLAAWARESLEESSSDAYDTDDITVFIEAMMDGYMQCEEFVIQKPPMGQITCQTATHHIRDTFNLLNGYLVQATTSASLVSKASSAAAHSHHHPQFAKVHPQTYLRSGIEYKFIDAVVDSNSKSTPSGGLRRSNKEAPAECPLVDTPVCKSTQERIMADYSTMKGVDSCPYCLLFKKNCPIACHPLDGGRELLEMLKSIAVLIPSTHGDSGPRTPTRTDSSISNITSSNPSRQISPTASSAATDVFFPAHMDSHVLTRTSSHHSQHDQVPHALFHEQLPEPYIRIFPSQSSAERERCLLQLLDMLGMNALPTAIPTDSIYEIDDYFIDASSSVNFKWQWSRANSQEQKPALIEKLCSVLTRGGMFIVHLSINPPLCC
jgi:hypothetical protein